MSQKRDYYETLGVAKTASQDEIKRAFRKLSKKWHPDMQTGKPEAEREEAKARFQEAAEAYEVLSDEQKRKQYDQFGHVGLGFSQGGFDVGEFMRRHGFGFGFSDFGFGGSPFGSSRSQEKPKPSFGFPENGKSVRIPVKLSFREMADGCEKTFALKLTKPCQACHGKGVDEKAELVKCPRCGGRGHVVETFRQGPFMSQSISDCPECSASGWKAKPCPACGGSRRQLAEKAATVKIPPGVEDGQRLRLARLGYCGVCGGQDGDLLVDVSVQDFSKLFKRRGCDLETVAYVDPATAALGGTARVWTPWGEIGVEVPAGSKSGRKIPVRGYGLPRSGSPGQRGDVYVSI